MKKIVLLLCLLSSSLLFSQITISGTVYDVQGNPLEGASVYVNNSSLGTTTNEQGAFYLQLPKGHYDLVVSYVGYVSEHYQLSTFKDTKPIRFTLLEKTNVLNEIVIQRRKSLTLTQKMNFLRRFKREFLGTSSLAQRCKIENKEVLEFDFEPKTQTIKVSSSEPIRIKHRGLGYTIYYDLVVFELTPTNVFFAGNMRYEEQEFKERKKKRIRKSRLKAYKGSTLHFLRSVAEKNVKSQGFKVDLMERVSNPNRPTNEQIAAAQEIIDEKTGLQNNAANQKKLFEAREVIEKSRRYTTRNRIKKQNLALFEYATFENGKPHLQFSDYLRITYINEFPDHNFKQKDDFAYQVSMISLFKQKAEILKMGILKNPLDMYLLGYWGFEKVGDTVPLDFEP